MTVNELLIEVTRAISRGNGENTVKFSIKNESCFGNVKAIHHDKDCIVVLGEKQNDLSQH